MNDHAPAFSVSVVLAAGSIPKDLQSCTSVDSILDLPAIWDSALAIVIARELSISRKVFVAHRIDRQVPLYLLSKFPTVNWVGVNRDESPAIGDSLNSCLRKLAGELESISGLRVIFGDTITNVLELDRVVVGLPIGNEDWTFAPKDFSIEKIDPRKWSDDASAVAGAFTFSEVKLFDGCLSQALSSRSTAALDPFFDAIFLYAKANAAGLVQHFDASWQDLGHRGSYFAFRKTQISGRSVNSFETSGFSIRKSSTREVKLAREALWYEKAPTSMFTFFPRVKIEKSGGYSMQYVEALSMGEKLLYGNPELIDWQWILGQLSTWFNRAAEYQSPTYESLDRAEIRRWFRDHFDQRLNGPAIAGLDEGVRIAYLESQQKVQSLIEDSCFKLADDFGTLAHGDMVFSNILVDESRELLKLIDPRGGFHEGSIFGPPIYDWAKLAQCIFGRYEELASDQFAIRDIENPHKVEFVNDPLRLRNYEILKDWFLSSCPDPGNAVRLAGLLLLTAIEFHKENRPRMNAMVIQGLELIEFK